MDSGYLNNPLVKIFTTLFFFIGFGISTFFIITKNQILNFNTILMALLQTIIAGFFNALKMLQENFNTLLQNITSINFQLIMAILFLLLAFIPFYLLISVFTSRMPFIQRFVITVLIIVILILVLNFGDFNFFTNTPQQAPTSQINNINTTIENPVALNDTTKDILVDMT